MVEIVVFFLVWFWVILLRGVKLISIINIVRVSN